MLVRCSMNEKVQDFIFVCATKAQLFNAINIKLSLYPDACADIYLCDMGTNHFSNLKKNVEQTGIFDNVFCYTMKYDTNQSFWGKLYKALYNIRDYRDMSMQLPQINKEYDAIFISGPSSAVNMVYYNLKKRLPHLKLFLYEEGVCEYYILASNRLLARKIYSLLFYGRYYIDDAEELYVYDPSLVKKRHQKVLLKSIPQVSINNEKLRNALNIVFGFKKDDSFSVSEGCVMFIDQAFYREKDEICQKKILQTLVDKVGKDKIFVKMHPGSAHNKYSGMGVHCITSNQTMEMIEFNYQLTDLTLVSVCSSALFNYKLIFGVNPNAILLFKIFEGQKLNKQLLAFVESFIDEYKEMNIVVPTNYEDLCERVI